MKEELIALAKLLMKATSRHKREVVSQYIHSINTNKLNTARIIADEIMDCYAEENADKKKIQLSSKLYDKTMEYYELNA
jgi:hypothetical protein